MCHQISKLGNLFIYMLSIRSGGFDLFFFLLLLIKKNVYDGICLICMEKMNVFTYFFFFRFFISSILIPKSQRHNFYSNSNAIPFSPCVFFCGCRVRFDNKCQNNVCFSFVFIKMEMTHKYMNLARMVDLQVELCCVYHCRVANNMELTFHRQRHFQRYLFGNTQKSQKLCTFVRWAMTSFTSFFSFCFLFLSG